MSLLTLIVMTAAVAAAAGELEVVILHTNDVHSRFDQADVGGSSCSEREAAAGQCWGGYARLATKVKEIRATYSNVLLLDAGDQFQGTVWYTVHKWRVVDHFMNLLQYDVMALGNHEFDDDIEGVVPFLHNNSFAVVSSNIDARHEPSMQGLFTSSTILSLTGNQKVGIVGYTTRDTPILAATGNLIFQDVIESVQNEARRLIAEEGVNKIIALGHGGLALDIEMAEKVEEIDVIVGGHTHTFLWTGTPPSVEIPAGPYPTIVKNSATNRDIPIVQAYTNGKYLGVLKVTFDDDGNVLVADGEPIPLDSSVHQGFLRMKRGRRAALGPVYRVVLPTYVYNGGDGYSMFKDEALSSIDIGVIDIDIIMNYMTKHQPISNGLDGRLTFSTDDPCANSSAPPLTTSLLLAICACYCALASAL
ncbi:PREDICTED: 5'-nucleotidase-like [Priapulus caudatus]|uniref:5'-nucleotidase n=1 Tax=Priapulus caudatus TaxID=37621 RepID=A0ABM1FBD0_PRICU|nr:PREDICTED: 5'-nucleotidase-like [Priapulus caudatus]